MSDLAVNSNAAEAEVGKDIILSINSGTSDEPVWSILGGQKSSDVKLKADELDTSSKTSSGFKTTRVGLKSWSLEIAALTILDDAALAILEQAYQEGVAVNIKQEYSDGTGQIGWAVITEMSLSTSYDGASELSATLTGDGELSKRAALL